jgi:hypothetical protein
MMGTVHEDMCTVMIISRPVLHKEMFQTRGLEKIETQLYNIFNNFSTKFLPFVR